MRPVNNNDPGDCHSGGFSAGEDAMSDARLAVIGGSGLYEFVDGAELIEIPTPYGPHSEGLSVGRLDGSDLAFLPRHGLGHRHPPHAINYRANLWALASLGVEQIIAPCAAGSLRPDLLPGSFVVPDQVVDRSTTRTSTFVETGALHISFADPYCPVGRSALVEAADGLGVPVVAEGVMVVIEGPRFSTRAESQALARDGWSLVNMTGMPEAALARELAMCYSSLALVTDLDAGIDDETSVGQADVLAVFERNLDVLCTVLTATLRLLPADRECPCAHALDGLTTDHLPPGRRNG
jgi:5'-methylthioadenosine phosphorylase